jgi:hypothetical protein
MTDHWREAYLAHLQSPAWQRMRELKFAEAGHCCERCGKAGPPLEVHHLTYERLGHELPGDLKVVCHECHVEEDKARAIAGRQMAASARYHAARDTFMTKKHGDDWWMYHRDSEEFDRWLERKRDDPDDEDWRRRKYEEDRGGDRW